MDEVAAGSMPTAAKQFSGNETWSRLNADPMLTMKRVELDKVKKAQENAKFQAEVAQLSLFPIFYKAGFVPQSAEQQQANVQGQANRGEQITGQIPASGPAPLPGEPKGE